MKIKFLLPLILLVAMGAPSYANENGNSKTTNQKIVTTPINEINYDSISVAEMIAIEKQYNQFYNDKLASLITSNFEKQYQRFDEEQIKFFKNFRYAFRWRFRSDDNWNNYLNYLSEKYFNPIPIKSSLISLSDKYQNDIVALRSNYYKAQNKGEEPSYEDLKLSDNQFLGVYSNSYANETVAVEMETKTLATILIVIIAWLVLYIIGFIWAMMVPQHHGRNLIILSTIIAVVLLIVSFNNNDKHMRNSLPANENAIIENNTNKVQTMLDNNTTAFYEQMIVE